LIIITQWNDFAKVRNFLVSQWLEITSAEGTYLPTTTVEVSEFDKALKVHTLIETLEEDEDVEAVWHNALIPQNLQEEIIAHIESHRFRT
jgi:transcriptional/translational regulatory protein YebC/TACO1